MAAWPYEQRPRAQLRLRNLGVLLTWAGVLALCLAAWYIIVAGLIGLFS